MATLSLWEKLQILFDICKSSNIFIIALAVMTFLMIVLITTNRMNVKTSRRLFIALYTLIFVTIFILYKDSLSSMVDYMMDNIFMVVYFPNLAVYFLSVVITSIILWISAFNFKATKIVKNINIVAYSIINYLLVVLLTIITDEKIDVFDQTSVYANKSAQAVIELTSMVFIIWILFLCFYKAIRLFQTKDGVKEYYPEPILEPIKQKKPKTSKKINFKVKSRNKVKEPQKDIERFDPKLPTVKRPSLNGTEPQMWKTTPTMVKNIQTTDSLNGLDKALTVEDYKVLLSMLKDKKEKEKQEVKIRKAREKAIKEERELEKFRELQSLYGARN